MRYAEIEIGYTVSFERQITPADVLEFATLTGDHSPLHVDHEFALTTPYKKNIVHGMLVASFFSTIVGMYCPGDAAVFLQQTTSFRQPVFVGDALTIRGTVVAKNDSVRMITLQTEALRGSEVVVSGEAKVKVLF